MSCSLDIEILVIIFAIMFLIVDLGYWVKSIVFYVVALMRSKISFTSASELYGVVFPSQSGFLGGHLNNAEYFPKLDFARMDHAFRTGMIKQTKVTGGGIAAAHTIRYRLPIQLFAIYKIVTKPVYWDSKFIYMDQRVITVRDGITRSVAYSKMSIGTDPEEYVAKNFKDVKCLGPTEMPEDLKDWIKFNETSSNIMKKELNLS